ncbi:GNAT family N-acetyltransferase [bacterium]|nr:GNAT family N-acetyltransferase [bacterium]MBU1984820.1 GNAT family N-acetyltransferase [bacterium]
MSTTFPPATSADVPDLLSMMRELYEYDHSPFDEQEHRRALVDLLANANFGRLWLIQFNGETVGYVILAFGYSLEFRGRDAFVDELFVCEPFRGRGIGSEALRFVEMAARELGIKALHLEVTRANARAQEVYRKFGYQDHDRYLMTKWLG